MTLALLRIRTTAQADELRRELHEMSMQRREAEEAKQGVLKLP